MDQRSCSRSIDIVEEKKHKTCPTRRWWNNGLLAWRIAIMHAILFFPSGILTKWKNDFSFFFLIFIDLTVNDLNCKYLDIVCQPLPSLLISKISKPVKNSDDVKHANRTCWILLRKMTSKDSTFSVFFILDFVGKLMDSDNRRHVLSFPNFPNGVVGNHK